MKKRDIETGNDVAILVDAFYNKVFQDGVLAPFFAHVDYPTHRPKMIAFWNFALLDIAGYTTQVWDAHANMRIAPPLFDHWVNLFVEAVDETFEGEVAEKAKLGAKTIGWTFKERMKAKLDNEES